MTLKELAITHGSGRPCGQRFVEITDKEAAFNDLNSTASCCWGSGLIGNTDWVSLCSPSIQSKGDPRTVFVCKLSLVADHPRIASQIENRKVAAHRAQCLSV